MNYPKSTRNEINKYLKAVRFHMQGAIEEEVDEVILHLQEQIDVALEESADAIEDPKNIRSILSSMPNPESFARKKDTQAKIERMGIVAVLASVMSWAFMLGAIHWFPIYGIVWFLFIAIAIATAVLSRKTVAGKVAIAILILKVVLFPFLMMFTA